MNPRLGIRPFKPDDRDQLFAIFRKAFKKDYDPAIWRWKFERNPFQPPDHPLIYVVTSGGEIAGSASLLPVPFQVQQRRIPFAWGTDLMVHPRFQGHGIAKEIYHYLSKKHDIVMSIGATEAAYQVLLKKTAWFKMFGFKRLSCYLDPAPYFHSQIPFGGKTIGWISRMLVRLVLSKNMNSKKKCPLKNISQIGSEFDQLWQEIEPYFPFSVCRTQQYLKWRYQSEPSKDYVFRGLYQDGGLRGFFVLEFRRALTKKGFFEARLMELVAHPTDAESIATLIQGAIAMSLEAKCHVVRCISTPGNEPHFWRERFYHFPRWDLRFFGSANLEGISIKGIKDPNLWMLTYGDTFYG